MKLFRHVRLTLEFWRLLRSGKMPDTAQARRPMCSTLAECCRTGHQLEQARAMLAELPSEPTR
ncbi:MAG: hypothetical protein KDB37_12860 [Ilumatobacter sp.]|nr:hypothetical protein [Ilumatobacter sp.]